MANRKYSRFFFGLAALPLWLALLTFGLTELFSRFPKFTETVYSQTIYPLFASGLSFLSKWVPFSLDDIFYGLLSIILLAILLMAVFRKIKFGRFLLLLFQTLAICYVLFYWFWGFNYYRSGINSRLTIAKSKPDTVQFVKVLEKLIARTNASYCTFDSISKSEITALVELSYQKNASFLKIDYPNGTRIPKPKTIRQFFAKACISRNNWTIFNEVHLNDSLLLIEYPQVLGHEFAHQFGITGEAEASFYSWLVCSQSESKHLRYSASLNTLTYFLPQAKRLHNFKDLVLQIDKPVINDIREIQKHWNRMRNEKIDQVAGKVNDAYLKTNKVEKGIEDYFGVVQFVMDFETDSVAQKRASNIKQGKVKD